MSENEKTHDRVQYAAAKLNAMPLSKLLGMRLTDIRQGEATVEIGMRDDLRQPGGLLHGGITATLIDTAMAFAVRTYLDDADPTATIDLTVHYLRPLTEGKAVCVARVVRAGRRIFTVSAEVFNVDGKLIASAISTYTRI